MAATGADARFVRTSRERLGLTQQALADLLDITRMTIWRYEHEAQAVPNVVKLALRYLLEKKSNEPDRAKRTNRRRRKPVAR
jgi:transcriptional regulator with XRE-family HTH domain